MSDLNTALLQSSEPESASPAWLQERRSAGRKAWLHRSMPTRKTEDWKYTSLHALQQEFQAAPDAPLPGTDLPQDLPDFGGQRLVFVDGQFNAAMSRINEESGLLLRRFSDASPEEAKLIGSLLGSAIASDKHLFGDLNDASLQDGVFMHIGKDAVIEAPVHLLWLTTASRPALSVNQRLLLLAEENSKATVIEHFAGAGGSFTNGLSELILQGGARVDHSRLHLEGAESLHIGGVHARLDRDSLLNSFHLALGSKLKRIDLVVNHQGPGAHCKLDGIYLLRGEEHVDYHSTIEHAVPHCTSEEVFRGIIGDKAKAVFNGRIHIHPKAQKTRAELSNKNLLTSAQAEINTKPELEIYADDVQCAHGATVAQLDDAMLHYLRTRGIPAAEARVMLSYGFINELVEAHALTTVVDFLKPLLADYFGGDSELSRHIGQHLAP